MEQDKPQGIVQAETASLDEERAEDRLRAAEAQNLVVLNSLAELVAFHDAELRLKWVNRVAADSLGMIPESLVGRHCYEVWHGRTRPCEVCPVVRAMKTGAFQEGEITSPDGRVWWIRGTPVKDKDGKVIGAVETTLEITARRRAEEAVSEKEQFISAIARMSPDFLTVFDFGLGRPVYFNRKLTELLGYSEEETSRLEPDAMNQLMHPEDLPKVRAHFGRIAQAADGEVLSVEYRMRNQRGAYDWFQSRDIVFKRDSSGRVLQFLSVAQNVTARKQAESRESLRLIRLERQQKAIVDIAAHEALLGGDLEKALRAIVTRAAAVLEVERVGVWLLSDDARQLRCEDSYLSSKDAHSSGEVLMCAQFPRYLAALQGSRAIDASDARQDLRTSEFVDDYLAPLGIGALLDAVIRVSGRVVGLVCHEHVGPPRQWHDDEVSFAGEVADQAAQALLNSERRKAEERLRQSESLHHSLVENLPQNIFRKGLDGRFTFANTRFCQALKRPLDEVLGKTDYDFFPTDLADKYRADDLRIIETAQPFETVEGHQAPGEPATYVQVVKTPLRDPDGRIIGVQGVFWDITDQKRAVESLRASEANPAAAQRIAHLGSWETILGHSEDMNTNPLRWSDEVFRIFGYDPGTIEVSRDNFYRSVHPEDVARVKAAVAEAIRQRKTYNIEHRITRPDSTERIVHELAEVIVDESTGRPLKLVGTVQDVTQQRQLESQFRQAQKMEGIGQLAGGVAHDFNNILTVILGNAALALEQRDLPVEVLDNLGQISEAAGRASKLTRQLLTFSRKQKLQPKFLDVSTVVSGLAKMLRRMIGEDIELNCVFLSELPLIHADAGMLEQVVMNLAVNARDAMPKGGKLEIITDAVEVDAAHAQRNPAASPGEFVRLSVRDTGAGIAPEDLPRIFEPFYTTKEVGKGTGLGLATAYGIVMQHNGWIEVSSELGCGTTFDIYLPASIRSSADVEQSAAAGVRGGTETVLVVEDDASVRGMVARVLRRHGYTVLEATDGPGGLEAWQRHAKSIDLVLTDLVMPGGMTGIDLADQIRVTNPELKVIFTSGYSQEVATKSAREAHLEPGRDFIQKPYQPDEMARIVRERLDRP